MTTIALPNQRHLMRGAWPVIGFAGCMSFFVPWGLPIADLFAHQPALRVTTALALILAGVMFAGRCGLTIAAVNQRAALRDSLGVIVAMGVYLVFIDAVAFRHSLPVGYAAYESSDLAPRLVYYVLRAASEAITYQLAIGSALVWLLGLVWRDEQGRVASGAVIGGLLLAHLLNVAIDVHIEPQQALYVALRFFVPGIAWAVLYRRHGLQAVLLAHCGLHVALQPVMTHLL